ncbi:MAG: hypothetical protein J0L84_07670 [Verrucomicrobia bacterium]|nr:hypothetical protein [Verrucomicrobiota bacterium]
MRLLLTLLLPLGVVPTRSGAETPPPPWPLAVLATQEPKPDSVVWRVFPKLESGASNSNTVARGRVIASRDWPAGRVPVFAVESESRVTLRRVPPVGRENFSEPLFFALPPEDEPQAIRLAGRWRLESRSREGRQHRLAMDWSTLGEQAAGRLDQETDFRFAYLTGATWKADRLSLTVEYIADRYEMSGVWTNGVLRGSWRQVPEGDDGTWEAVRPIPERTIPPAESVLPLFEWRRDGDKDRRYTVGDAHPGDGWQREPRPLCRVWPPS